MALKLVKAAQQNQGPAPAPAKYELAWLKAKNALPPGFVTLKADDSEVHLYPFGPNGEYRAVIKDSAAPERAISSALGNGKTIAGSRSVCGTILVGEPGAPPDVDAIRKSIAEAVASMAQEQVSLVKPDARGTTFDPAVHETHTNGEPKTDSFGHFIKRAFEKVKDAL